LFRSQRAPAIVVLQIVDPPRREGIGVLGFVALSAGLARARLGRRALVNAQLEALAVNVGGERRDAARELRSVPLKVSTGVTPAHPAVVDVDVLVSDGGHAARNEGVGDALDQGLAGAASEGVPRVPAHGRRCADRRRARTASGTRRSASPLASRRRRTSGCVSGLTARGSRPTGAGRPPARVSPDPRARLAAGRRAPAGGGAARAKAAALASGATGPAPAGGRAALAR